MSKHEVVEQMSSAFLRCKAVTCSGVDTGVAVAALEKHSGKEVRRICRGFLKAKRAGKIRGDSSIESAIESTSSAMGLLAYWMMSALAKALLTELVHWAMRRFDYVESNFAGSVE
jgi:hypothetical protein